MKRFTGSLERAFEWLTTKMTQLLGHSMTFFIASLLTVGWITFDVLINKPFHSILSDLFVAFTFLLVFIIQKSQNKFATGIHIKLNELVASHDKASNRLIKIEDMSEEELKSLAAHYEQLATKAKKGEELMSSQSIEQVLEEAKEEAREEAKEKENKS